MCELGWKSLGVLELTALPSIDEENWVPMVRETDVLLVNGGDPMYLCHWMRQSGLADLLPSLRETVYVGLSAGSMVMTPNIGEDFVRWTPPTGGDKRWEWLISRSFRTWITRICPRTPWPTQKNGPPVCRCRRTQSTMRPRSKWSTAPSKSYPKGTGSSSLPKANESPARRRGFRDCAESPQRLRTAPLTQLQRGDLVRGHHRVPGVAVGGDGDPERATALDRLALGDDAGVGDPGGIAFGLLGEPHTAVG